MKPGAEGCNTLGSLLLPSVMTPKPGFSPEPALAVSQMQLRPVGRVAVVVRLVQEIRDGGELTGRRRRNVGRGAGAQEVIGIRQELPDRHTIQGGIVVGHPGERQIAKQTA